MQQVAEPDDERGGHERAPDQAEDAADRAVEARGDVEAGLEGDQGEERLADRAEVGGLEAAVALADAGPARDRDAGGGAVDDRLDDRGGQHQRHPEPGVDVVDRAEAAEQRTVDDDGLGRGERRTRGDAERERVDHVVERGPGGQEDRADLAEDQDSHRDEDHEGQQRRGVDTAGLTRSVRGPVAEDPGVPQEREADPQRGREPDGAEHHTDRLVLPLVDVVHVDDVDGGDDDRGGDEGEGQEAERAGDDRDQHAQADRPAVGLRRRAAGQRHQRRDHVEAVDRLAGLERERLTALGATGAELGPGHGVEPSSWRGDGRHGAATALGGGLRGAGHRCPPCEVLLEGASSGCGWVIGRSRSRTPR